MAIIQTSVLITFRNVWKLPQFQQFSWLPATWDKTHHICSKDWFVSLIFLLDWILELSSAARPTLGSAYIEYPNFPSLSSKTTIPTPIWSGLVRFNHAICRLWGRSMDNANFATESSAQNMWFHRYILVLQKRFEWAKQYLNKARMSDMITGYPCDIHIWWPS